jgi:guanine deaminase
LLADTATPAILIPEGSFLLPTFCDLHLHAPQFLYQGTGLHLPLMEWLNKYAFQAEERIDLDPGLAKRVYERLATRLIENGTGMVVLFGTIRENTKFRHNRLFVHDPFWSQ